ncbi:Hypothetical predicted protein, partial [Scomber scombrus]
THSSLLLFYMQKQSPPLPPPPPPPLNSLFIITPTQKNEEASDDYKTSKASIGDKRSSGLKTERLLKKKMFLIELQIRSVI